jgi:hypothetical protein
VSGDATCFGARTTRQGKASHRGHRGHRGGLIGTEAVSEAASGDTTVSVRERLARGMHRTEVTEAGREAVSGDTTASVRERLARGKHRTEVTEAAEGD